MRSGCVSYHNYTREDRAHTSLPQTLADHQHPIFAGVVVCVSGIDDIDRRVEINKLVNAHGGSFRKELQRPVDVTHLLCSGDVSEPTDKMHYAERFNQRGETDIKLVWEEWFWDCLEFGGHFDEEKYLVKSQPRPERRRRPVEAPPQPSVPDTTTPHDSQTHRQPQPATSRRASTSRLSTTNGVYTNNGVPQNNKDEDAELEDEEAGRVNTNFTALCIWESLLKVRGYAIDGGRVVRSPTRAGSVGVSSLTVSGTRACLNDTSRAPRSGSRRARTSSRLARTGSRRRASPHNN